MSRMISLLAVGLLFLGYLGLSQQTIEPETIEPSRVKVLLIGNSAYRNWPPLPTSRNNIKVLSEALDRLGFASTVVADADNAGLETAIRQFCAGLKKNDIAMFYYSGYAVQNRRNDNHLIPVDFPAKNATLERNAYPVSLLETDFMKQGVELRIMILE